MSFEQYEESVEEGQPIELFDFSIGVENFRYTTNQIALTVAGLEYQPLPISRKELALSQEKSTSERMEVQVPGDNVFVRKFVSIVPGQRARVTIKKLHRVDLAAEVVILYKGAVQSVSFRDNGNVATLLVAPLTAAKSRGMPRLTFQSLCGHAHYDGRCKVSETNPAFEKFLPVTAVSASGTVLTLTGAGGFGFADFFVSGFIQFNNDYRMVIAQSGNDLTIILPFGSSPNGQTVRVLAGCKHRLAEDCDAKYSNSDNYGGFPFVPTKNPFATGID